MLRPVILIGCGGAGQKTVRYARESVARRLKQAGWDSDFPTSWQFIAIDTNASQEIADVPFLPINDFVNITQSFKSYQDLNSAIEAKFDPSVDPQAFAELQGWRPNPSQIGNPYYRLPPNRPVGRLLFAANQRLISKRIEFAFSQCIEGGPELTDVSQHLQVNVPPGTPVPSPLTIIVGSMAGGTGAGIMLDVVDLVRRTDVNGAFPVLIAFTPDIFGSIQTEAMTANSAAFMSEMMSAYWDDEATDSALIPSKVAVHTRGPHSIYLIGRKTINGLDLLESTNVFRAVSEVLNALTTSHDIQHPFFNFHTVVWPNVAPANAGGYGFQPAQLKGVASSFGSATISIGRDRFRLYLEKLLHRSIVEHLAFGCEPIGNAILGEATKTMDSQEINSNLAHHFLPEFLAESGLQESEKRLLQILADNYSSNASNPKSTSNFDDALKLWGSQLFHNLLKTVNRFVEKTGYLLVIELLHLCRKNFNLRVTDFRFQIESVSRENLQSKNHQLNRNRVCLAFESIDASLLEEFEAALTKSLGRIYEMAKTQDGRPAIIDSWPQNDGQVPSSFRPSSVEFFLEDYSTWPDLTNDLLSESLSEVSGLSEDPVEATKQQIIRGGFGGSQTANQTPPLIWPAGNGPTPEWDPGQRVSITIADDHESMTKRINDWLSRPKTKLQNVLSEGISSYLMPLNSNNGEEIPDHQWRLTKYRELLTEVLKQSYPLIEIDNVLNLEIHPKPLSYTMLTQGFPFAHGHPAREVTKLIIQGFLNTAASVDWAFSSGDAESVLITNFLEYPVHPSVVNSFTQPLNKALGKFDADLLRSSFWQWRRARILENFIPLPDSLRIAAIRGFAVARILGTVTAEPQGENKISTSAGVLGFPKNLLTETDRSNILPALLEAMILAFADAPIKGKAAFNAYGALIEYGTGGGLAAGFEITDEVARILSTGDYGNIQILDQMRAKALASDPQGRIRHALHYLDANIARYDALIAMPLDFRSWRNQVGCVEPVDTMSLELIGDLRKAYVQVKEAILRFERSSQHGELGVV